MQFNELGFATGTEVVEPKRSLWLTKWYLDCVSQEGDVAILYAAEVHWGRLNLHYSSLLRRRGDERITKTSLRSYIPRNITENELTVDAPLLGVKGTWRALVSPIRKTLLKTIAGEVDWHCFQPKAAVNLTCDGDAIEGLGYAECLTVTIPPWQLPIRRLQWGRFLSQDECVVWIDWSGAEPKRWLWRNGEECEARSLDESGICFRNAEELKLDRGITLRQGRLGTTVLPGAPALKRVFPSAMFGIDEHKWLSGGEILNGSRGDKGWAIHETVDWMQ